MKRLLLLPLLNDFKKALRYEPETGFMFWSLMEKDFPEFAKAGKLTGTCKYLQIAWKHEHYLVHRLAWLFVKEEEPPIEIDHIDMNKINNKWENLREADRSLNNMNRSIYSNNTTGFKGVHFHKPLNKFQAKIRLNGILIHLGYFLTPQEAFEAYKKASIKYHGEFGRSE